jgi:hypothetical protein
MTIHGFPVLTDGALGVIEDPDRALQLMEAVRATPSLLCSVSSYFLLQMGHWLSVVLSKIDLPSCVELSHFLRPVEVSAPLCLSLNLSLSVSPSVSLSLSLCLCLSLRRIVK